MNAQQNEKMRQKLLMKPSSKEVLEQMKDDPQSAELWYQYGMALAEEAGAEEAVDAFSQGLVYHPFDPDLYFARGRKNNGGGRPLRALADLTMAIRLDPECWNYWYYRATTYNTNGQLALSIKDFKTCIEVSEKWEHYPMVHWLYTTYIELGDFAKAEESLELTDCSEAPPQMDYGYNRCVKLYKGVVTPEEFVDLADMEEKCLKQPNRINLELNTMYYGLYAFSHLHGDEKAADNALRELLKIAIPNAFGCMKGKEAAKKRGVL